MSNYPFHDEITLAELAEHGNYLRFSQLKLASELHASGISLCIDLVINHTSKEHEWAQRAMAGEEEYLNYYYTFGDRTLPDAYERTLPEIFPDFAPGNFSYYPEIAGSGRWVWTTFNYP